MWRWMAALLIGLLMATGCDEPDEVYKDLPSEYDPEQANGMKSVNTFYTGTKGFEDPTLTYISSGPSVEVCTDSEVSTKQAEMVRQPIIPMVGAGGLDMTGGADWAGLTIDEAQSPDVLCQALYYADGIAAWGDYFELIAFFDEQTRQIDDILIRAGYEGTVEAGNFSFEINQAIKKGSTPLSRSDGSVRDPRTEDNMRAIDRALITAFRPSLDAEQVDCVEAGSCYVIMSGTLPVMVFMSVGLYVVLEPVQMHIVQLEVSLKRPFRVGSGEAEVNGMVPMIKGTAAADIPNCEITWGTDWADIERDCLSDDPMAMATVTSVFGYEMVLVGLGGTLLYLERPGLAADEILPIEPTPKAGDKVSIISINAAYEGAFSMPYSDILRIFKTNLDAAIRAEVPTLLPEDKTGIERLRTPDDPDLPTDVVSRYVDRLRPGGIYAAFCDDDGPDTDTTYDSCLSHSSGRPVLPLVATLQELVSAELGASVTPKLADSSFYVQQFERAMGEYFNEGPLSDDQINYSPSSSRPDTIYATISIVRPDDSYTINMYYGGNDDRIHFLNFQKGTNRMEDVLMHDASLPTQTDPQPSGIFTFDHLLGSPRMGLGAKGTVSIKEVFPETRRAMISVKVGASEEIEVLAPYLEASSLNGYWTPLEGPHDQFTPADWFSLSGNTIGAGFYLTDDPDDPSQKEIVAITGSGFFGDVYFCGFPVRIGDYASELLADIEDAQYPCEMIVRRSENREFITSLTDMDTQTKIYVTGNMIDQVVTWLR